MTSCCDQMDRIDILFIAANTRSLAINRGPLIRALQDKGLCIGALVPDEDFLEEVHALGVRTWNYTLERHAMGIRAQIVHFLQLRRLIRKIMPKAVFAYAIKPIILGIPAAWVAGVRETYCLATGLGYLYGRNNRRMRAIRSLATCLYALSGALSVAFFFQNPDDRAELERHFLFRRFTKSVVVNGSGVDLNEYVFSPVPIQPLSFLFMGRFLREKGIYDFIKAARLVAKKHPSVKFMALGIPDPTLVNSISETELVEWKREGIVQLPGKVRDVKRHLAAASVIVLPSYYREGIPRTLLESLSTGRAIITCDSPGCREAVIDGFNGWLVPPKSAELIAERMEEFIRNPELVTLMGQHGRYLAEKRFATAFVNQQMLSEMRIANAIASSQALA